MLTPETAKRLHDKYLNDPEVKAAWMSAGHPLHSIAVGAIGALRFYASGGDRSGPAARMHAKALMPLSPILSEELGVTVDWSDQFSPTEIAQGAIGWLTVRANADEGYRAALLDANHPGHAEAIAEREAVYQEAFPLSPEQAAKQAQPSIDAAQAAVDAAKAAYDQDSTDATKLQAWADAMTALAEAQDAAKAIPTTQEAKPVATDPKQAIKDFEASERWQQVATNPAALGRQEAIAERAALYDAAFPRSGPDVVAVVGSVK